VGYHSPSKSARELSSYLEKFTQLIREYSNSPLIVLGDFNARHALLDPKCTSHRGVVFYNWMYNLGLHIVNKRFVTTCIKARGESVVDLVCVNDLGFSKFRDWQVFDPPVSSDHKIIVITLKSRANNKETYLIDTIFPRWSFKNLNEDLLRFTCRVADWFNVVSVQGHSDEQVKKLCAFVKKGCDISMKRSVKHSKKATYWWTTSTI